MSAATCTTSSLSPLASLSPAVPAATPASIPAAVRRGAWRMSAGQAMSLRASTYSVLRIRQGRVWVTRDATAHWGSEDLVLAPGDSLHVDAGERIVMEAWDGNGATYTWDAASA